MEGSMRCHQLESSERSYELNILEDDSGSIEMPIRKQRNLLNHHRPIIELVLGVLDTIHSSTKSEIKRIRARNARSFEIQSSTESPVTKTINKSPHSKKRVQRNMELQQY